MSYTVTRTNYLEVNSVPLSTPAWWITNLEHALAGRTLRGSDLLLPGTTGRRRRRRYIDEHIAQFEMVVRGMVKWDGTAHASASAGYQANCDQLLGNLGLASSSVLTATWHLAAGGTRTASVDIESISFSELGTHRDGKCVLEIAIPAGAFA